MYHVPGPPLSDFVTVFWYYGGGETPNATDRVLPTGAVDLIIRLDSARISDSAIFGPRTRSAVVKTTSRNELIGVHFKLGGAFPFLHIPASELENAGVSINQLWGESEAQRLLGLLRDAPTGQGKFQIIEEWLLRLAGNRLQKHPAVVFALREFLSGPFGSAAELADKTGYSHRYFIELFKNEVGLTPKRAHRLCRFRKVLENIQSCGSPDWTATALSAGYFDQAHLIHEFREFSGVTPEQYLALRTPFINHVRIRD